MVNCMQNHLTELCFHGYTRRELERFSSLTSLTSLQQLDLQIEANLCPDQPVWCHSPTWQFVRPRLRSLHMLMHFGNASFHTDPLLPEHHVAFLSQLGLVSTNDATLVSMPPIPRLNLTFLSPVTRAEDIRFWHIFPGNGNTSASSDWNMTICDWHSNSLAVACLQQVIQLAMRPVATAQRCASLEEHASTVWRNNAPCADLSMQRTDAAACPTGQHTVDKSIVDMPITTDCSASTNFHFPPPIVALRASGQHHTLAEELSQCLEEDTDRCVEMCRTVIQSVLPAFTLGNMAILYTEYKYTLKNILDWREKHKVARPLVRLMQQPLSESPYSSNDMLRWKL